MNQDGDQIDIGQLDGTEYLKSSTYRQVFKQFFQASFVARITSPFSSVGRPCSSRSKSCQTLARCEDTIQANQMYFTRH